MPHPSRATVALLISVVSALSTAAAGDHWPQFRGPRAGVVADDPALPARWSRDTNVAWKFDLPGFSWGSPIVC